MKILWVNNIFLHPTNKGGQIRTLEMLKRLHRKHEVHYAAFDNGAAPEDIARASEYASHVHPVRFQIAPKYSPAFFKQLAVGLVSPVPIVVERKRSPEMQAKVRELLAAHRFDSLVCDFLTPSINLPDLERWVVFQHNVETMIFRRYAENASGLRRWYFQTQAERLFRYEQEVCRTVRHVVAVSENDARIFREMFGAPRVSWIPTGVDLEYFAPRSEAARESADLVFVGSMDWMPNIDGMTWFADEVLPLIRRRKPDCSIAIVGRTPVPRIVEMGQRDPKIRVTGTVPDVRPYLWGGGISIVPLRIGGGTRLKIYESMAARIPVVSTTIGAEGLETHSGRNLILADTAEAFAEACVSLLDNAGRREAIVEEAWQMIAAKYSWESVTAEFEQKLEHPPAAAH